MFECKACPVCGRKTVLFRLHDAKDKRLFGFVSSFCRGCGANGPKVPVPAGSVVLDPYTEQAYARMVDVLTPEENKPGKNPVH